MKNTPDYLLDYALLAASVVGVDKEALIVEPNLDWPSGLVLRIGPYLVVEMEDGPWSVLQEYVFYQNHEDGHDEPFTDFSVMHADLEMREAIIQATLLYLDEKIRDVFMNAEYEEKEALDELSYVLQEQGII